MKYNFTLLDTANNKLIEHRDTFDWTDENSMLFNWTQNNFSCDCNRRDKMYGFSDEHICGDEVILLKITDENGNIIFEEDKE
jgi:hypothetical protein